MDDDEDPVQMFHLIKKILDNTINICDCIPITINNVRLY